MPSAHYPADFFQSANGTFEFQNAVCIAKACQHFPAAAAHPLGRLRFPLIAHFFSVYIANKSFHPMDHIINHAKYFAMIRHNIRITSITLFIC